MQISWDFKLSPAEYSAMGRDSIVFPLLLKCPACHTKTRLYRHGFYSRNSLTSDNEYQIDICRYRCRSCLTTISLLPVFMLRGFQRTRNYILETLKTFFSSGGKAIYRQMLAFYLIRFRRNELGVMRKLPDEEIEKALKLIDLLADNLPGNKNNHGHRIHFNFMALSL